ncbi:MAG TPA: hypothetical protein VGJ00_00810 [Rhabdochlamydiaceae bacterium]|jgi:hypothetical protein
MTTLKQIEANHHNASLSTGPKTTQGKAVVRGNALKHGFFSKNLLLDEESEGDFKALKQAFCEHFQPQGVLETLFWERALVATWRLGRITGMESMVMNHMQEESISAFELIEGRNKHNELTLLSRYETALEKILFKSLAELRNLQNTRLNHPREIEIGQGI